MKVELETGERRARVEIIPLLDVLLIVLIFFVYLAASMTAQQAIGVQLPAGKGQPADRAVTVTIDRDNNLTVGGEKVTGDAVARILAAAKSAGIDPPRVVLRSDRRSSLGTSIELLAKLREAGVTEVSIEMEGR